MVTVMTPSSSFTSRRIPRSAMVTTGNSGSRTPQIAALIRPNMSWLINARGAPDTEPPKPTERSVHCNATVLMSVKSTHRT